MLTPKDIDQKVFKRALRGYSIDDVEDFLQELGESYETLYRENLSSGERIAMLSDAVRQYKSMEDAMQDTVEKAKKEAKDIEATARRNAERVLADAEKQAAEKIAKAEAEVATIRYREEQIKHSVEVYRAKVVELLHEQLESIKEYGTLWNGDFAEQEREVESEFQNTAEIPPITRDNNGKYSEKR